MYRRHVALAVLLFLFVSYASLARAEGRVAVLSDSLVTEILQQVNQRRASLGVSAMPLLEWDAPLAAFAATTVAKCRMQHTSTMQRQQIPGWVGQYTGENLAMAYRSGMRLEDAADERHLTQYFRQAMDGWWGEQADYDLESNQCASGKTCGHYTQLAWRQTRKIGCALAMCNPQLDVGRLGYTIACNFLPGGNIAGQRPY